MFTLARVLERKSKLSSLTYGIRLLHFSDAVGSSPLHLGRSVEKGDRGVKGPGQYSFAVYICLRIFPERLELSTKGGNAPQRGDYKLLQSPSGATPW